MASTDGSQRVGGSLASDGFLSPAQQMARKNLARLGRMDYGKKLFDMLATEVDMQIGRMVKIRFARRPRFALPTGAICKHHPQHPGALRRFARLPVKPS